MTIRARRRISGYSVEPTWDMQWPSITPLDKVVAEWSALAAEAHAAFVAGNPLGPRPPLERLSRVIGGQWPRAPIVLHAQPGVGKTSFALQSATEAGCPTLFVTAEMRPVDLLQRLTARLTETPLSDLKSGKMPAAEVTDLARRAASMAGNVCILDATQGGAPPHRLQVRVREVRGGASHCLVIVDSLHSLAFSVYPELPEYEALNVVLAALVELTIVEPCSVLAIVERNRANMTEGGLSAGAGSRKIEYSASLILELHSNTSDRPDADGKLPVSLHITKNRDGPSGIKLPLYFYGALQMFCE